jgi:hypothetical protein
MNIQFVCQSTNATQSYEKTGIIVEGINNDPSDYSQPVGITKDGTAISGMMTISASNQAGRAWGHEAKAKIQSGGDGLLVASERGCSNFGTAQPNFDTPTTKVIDNLVAGDGGAVPITAFTHRQSGTGRTFSGDISERSAFVDQDNAMAYGIRDTDGIVKWGLLSGGGLRGRRLMLDQVVTQDGKPPLLNPGESCIWGNAAIGQVFLVYYDGVNYLRIPFGV